MQESNRKKRVIGLSGVARAGKDTFAAILSTKLFTAGYSVKKIALADPLKADCDAFCKEHFGFSAFTQIPEEKLLIRPFLVWYGDAQRKRTGGRYWIDKAQATIDSTDFDYYIVTDVRYAHYDRDEIYWLKHECKGVVCHVSKWSYDEKDSRNFVPPANDHEAINDPKVKEQSDHRVEWKHLEGLSPEKLVTAPALQRYVDEFINRFDLAKHQSS